MSTKDKPGQFDCYSHALDDEPMFVLLARDVTASVMVRMWAELRIALDKNEADDEQIAEAIDCAASMDAWRKRHADSNGR
jgi:hypothetical protein